MSASRSVVAVWQKLVRLIGTFQDPGENGSDHDGDREAERFFEYHSLPTHLKEIRLLRCSGGHSSFQVHQVSLDDAPTISHSPITGAIPLLAMLYLAMGGE
jgi:hypothetical protein